MLIRERAVAVGVGLADVDEIDRVNIYWATVRASQRALAALSSAPDHVLVDGRKLPGITLPQTHMVGGDRRSFCIAAASIVAKVTRDQMMTELDANYPNYGFAQHKGYCTADHIEALTRHGPSPIHRRSFALVQAALQSKLF